MKANCKHGHSLDNAILVQRGKYTVRHCRPCNYARSAQSRQPYSRLPRPGEGLPLARARVRLDRADAR